MSGTRDTPLPTTRPALSSHVRKFRELAGLSQLALARQVGVSRQAILAVEAGRQVPSTLLSLQLARALGCRVDDLFALSHADELTVHVAKSLAPSHASGSGRVAVGCVAGRWIAHPLADDAGTAADGLLLDELPGARVGVDMHSLEDPELLANNVLVAGCAPLLGCLSARIGRRHQSARATWISENSTHALQRLKAGEVHVAGLHLTAAQSGADHGGIIAEHFPGQRMLLVNLTQWRLGLLVPRGNPLGIHTIGDVLRPTLRVARREPGSGVELLLRRLLGPSVSQVEGPLATNHRAVAQLLQWGAADVGVAIEHAALNAGLDFVPLAEERFDLVIPAAFSSAPPVAALLNELNAGAFRREAAGVPGYDASLTGQSVIVEAA